jgi:hypothetical protein
MRLLHEIVIEEMQKFYPLPVKVEDGVAHINLRDAGEEIRHRKEHYLNRIENDIALTQLCFIITSQIDSFGKAGGLTAEQKKEAYAQAFVEGIMIWEAANNRFNEQLGMPPQLTAPKT